MTAETLSKLPKTNSGNQAHGLIDWQGTGRIHFFCNLFPVANQEILPYLTKYCMNASDVIGSKGF